MAAMNTSLLTVINAIDKNELVNPMPLDEACCQEFEKWAKTLHSDSTAKLCPFCGTKISAERKEKFFIAEA